jgi:hypothetical protein
MARYRSEGEAAHQPRLRAPKTSPGATPPPTVELVLRLRKQLLESGHDAGAETIAWQYPVKGTVVGGTNSSNGTWTCRVVTTRRPPRPPKHKHETPTRVGGVLGGGAAWPPGW